MLSDIERESSCTIVTVVSDNINKTSLYVYKRLIETVPNTQLEWNQE